MGSFYKASDNQTSISSQSLKSKQGSGKDKSGDKNPDNITDLNLKNDLKFMEKVNCFTTAISILQLDSPALFRWVIKLFFNFFKFNTLNK